MYCPPTEDSRYEGLYREHPTFFVILFCVSTDCVARNLTFQSRRRQVVSVTLWFLIHQTNLVKYRAVFDLEEMTEARGLRGGLPILEAAV